MLARVFALCAPLLLLAGCYTNNLPISDRFGPIPTVATARVFVDANGQFYPDRWQARYGAKFLHKIIGLENLPPGDPRKAEVAQDAQAQLDRIAAQMAGKSRVFILIHGYNNSEWEADYPFDQLTRRIDPGPRDIVIRFHWDGLVQTSQGGQLGSWFKAAGYSQMAGMRGLRRILNLARNQDLFLISHSRGASVALSALANPSFAPKFQAATEAIVGPFADVPPLAERGNRIRLIMLAPAIGRPDFWAASCGGVKGCDTLRTFSPQLTSIQYTVNRGDPVLRKVVSPLASRFNATDLGYEAKTGEALRERYRCLVGTELADQHAHAFALYAEDPEFDLMLKRATAATVPCIHTSTDARP